MALRALFAVAGLLSAATAVADEPSASRPTAVPGVDGSYFVVPPDIAKTLAALGREESLGRLDDALQQTT